MITFTDYWDRITKANPHLAEALRLTMTTQAFRQALEKAFNEGHEAGRELKLRTDSLFGRIFG